MGVATEIKKRAFAIFEARREELLHENFEPQLKRLGLSVELINLQDLDQLNLSLLKVNDAISHPESFGTLKIMISADAELVLAKAPQEAHMEIGILPLLLERKSLILNRIRTLVGERRSNSLKELLATVADPQLKKKLEKEVSSLAEQSRRLAEQESALAQAQAEQIAKRDEALGKLNVELFERRLRAWTGFFARPNFNTIKIESF